LRCYIPEIRGCRSESYYQNLLLYNMSLSATVFCVPAPCAENGGDGMPRTVLFEYSHICWSSFV
jgi:hypothetical protein